MVPFFTGTANCKVLEVTGDDGDLSGTYSLNTRSGAYTRVDGSITYIIGASTDGAFYLGEGTSVYQAYKNYPFYYVSQLQMGIGIRIRYGGLYAEVIPENDAFVVKTNCCRGYRTLESP